MNTLNGSDKGYINARSEAHDYISRNRSLDPTEFVKLLKEVVKNFNAAFAEQKLPFSANADDTLSLLATMPYQFTGERPIANFLRGDNSGKLWNTQIRTMVDALATVLKNPGKSGAVVGATMCGKTGTANACYILAMLLHLATKDIYRVCTLLPSRSGIKDQAWGEYKQFRALYGLIQFRFKNGQPLDMKNYYENFLPEVEEFDMITEDQENSTFLGRSGATTKTKKNNSLVKKMRNLRKEKNVKMIYVVDELDWGAAHNSILNDICGYLANETGGDFMIGFSATPWQVINLDCFWKVYHRLSETYCGFPYFNGKDLDPEMVGKIPHPECMSLKQMADRFDIPDFAKIHSPYYKNELAFNAEVNRQLSGNPPTKWTSYVDGNWMDYRKKVENAIISMINKLWKLNPKKGRGFVLRLESTNEGAYALVERFKKSLNKDIEILPYLGEEGKESAEKRINGRNGFKKNKPYLVILTGAGRMADKFPPDTTYFFDFTANNSNYRSIFQGLPGRASGNGKAKNPPMVCLPEKSYNMVMDYISTKGVPNKKPHPHVDSISNTSTAGRDSLHVTLIKEKVITHNSHPIVNTLIGRIENLCLQLNPNKSRPSFPRTEKDKLTGERSIWKTIFTETTLQYLEDNASTLFSEQLRDIKLLRFGELDSTGFAYGNGFGFRRHDAPASSNSNLAPDRTKKGGKGRDNKDGDKYEEKCIEIQIHVRQNRETGRWELVGLKLRLAKSGNKNIFKQNWLPNGKTMYNNYL